MRQVRVFRVYGIGFRVSGCRVYRVSGGDLELWKIFTLPQNKPGTLHRPLSIDKQ